MKFCDELIAPDSPLQDAATIKMLAVMGVPIEYEVTPNVWTRVDPEWIRTSEWWQTTWRFRRAP